MTLNSMELENPSFNAATEEHVVVFRLAAESYALDIQRVQEIVRMQTITSIPGVDAWVEGITNLRGRVVPVMDLRRRCGIPVCEYTSESRIVVVSSENGMVGLVVDAVSEVMRIPAGMVELPGGIVSAPENAYVRGIAKLDDRLIALVDLNALLPVSISVTADDVQVKSAA